MLPPVDRDVLRDNPQFAKLHAALRNDLLNPDGSTKPRRRPAHAHQADLADARLQTAKLHLLERALAASRPASPATTTSSGGSSGGSSGALARLLLLLPSLVGDDDDEHDSAAAAAAALGPDAAALLLSSPPFCDLPSLLPQLGSLASAQLHASALCVARVAHPSRNPSFLHRCIPSLPGDHAALRQSLAGARAALVDARLDALALLADLLRLYTQSLALLIQRLEFKHVVAARNLELRALDVSLAARQTARDAATAASSAARDVYTPDTLAALANYSSHLKDAHVRAAERVRGLKAELAEYGVGADNARDKEKTMRALARTCREMERQMEDVNNDLDRLRGRTR
ncbi:uncharacterized protein UV8b_00447 [Ustilaginoidea virens]|uniref:HAUS augmin-like complex subunit 4 n=1 Tax=Ustilaginoidea virens TaxID=1159556 RepID=A0A1B5KVJ1_USTVR|nr:uncharacterized protein UV8b_00447 [Ustilaginoidea virens]QUC16206.1 hypothetical protein UV8b_00447 [Ustilaginoidea virens]GAO15029.1 hypothetical protein UVI_02027490 [Ustilaginoidea virens]